ncbi:MAG: glycosyltransferase family 4 protein [Prevotellaceae bacterium]|jgi:glycosyltransferase involved in cell wall biosynthesis|nr:glycosyltransferase family 4 protein [Prevotellaceae bacterium]
MNNNKRIVISVSSDLSTDQRVQKTTASLHRAGYRVLLVGRQTKQSLPFHAPYPFKRFRLLFSKGFLFYAELNLRLFFFLLVTKTDILLANDTDTLLPNFWAAKIRSKQLVFDAHELFPELPELTHRPLVKAIWQSIEKLVFPHLKNAFTVCKSIADYYKNRYNLSMGVVRNFPNRKHSDTNERKLFFEGKKIILYQGAVNVGRGLEWVIEAMPQVENAVLVIIGDGDVLHKLKQTVNEKQLDKQIIFLGKILPAELPAYTRSADLGLCLLENLGLSYFYSLPNRIFDYMQAGVPVLASNFPEIANIVGTHHTGTLISHYEPDYLASVITDMLKNNNPDERKRLIDMSNNFVWESEEAKLLTIFAGLK